MERRTFVKHAAAWATARAVNGIVPSSLMAEEAIHKQPEHAPMELGLLIKPSPDPEAKIRLVHELGFKTCFLSLDGYLNHFTPALTRQFEDLLDKYKVIATTAEVVYPQPLKWNFVEVLRAYRKARLDALKQCSDFAKTFDIGRGQTHWCCNPEYPNDA